MPHKETADSVVWLNTYIGLPLHAFAFSEQKQASETENSNRRQLWLATIPVRKAKKCVPKQLFLKKKIFFGILLHLVIYCVIMLHISKDVTVCS